MAANIAHRFSQASLSLALCPVAAMAADTVDSVPAARQAATIGTENLNSGYLVQLIAGLLFVLVCIVALAWVAKRVNRLHASSVGSLQVLGGISMGARERVVLVQVGSTQLLLGVAPGRINMLHQLEHPVEQAHADSRYSGSTPVARGFADKLNAALTRNR